MIISLCIAIPFLTALIILAVPRSNASAVRWIALFGAMATFIVSLVIFTQFVPGNGGYCLEEKVPWIQSIGAEWHVGVDGISLFLIMLTTLLALLCVISSWTSIKDRIKEYFFLFVLMEGALIGVFSALDLFLFYVMWEVQLIPMFFLIGVWGGERRIYATIKFFLFTFAGSVLMLAGILYVYFHTTVEGAAPGAAKHTFDLIVATKQAAYTPEVQTWLFLAFVFAFAVKVPLFPVHTWLPDAHTEAPTAGSVMLAGVLLKLFTYGFLLF
jgi:NADH-quinone oxidoreductase subunit M